MTEEDRKLLVDIGKKLSGIEENQKTIVNRVADLESQKDTFREEKPAVADDEFNFDIHVDFQTPTVDFKKKEVLTDIALLVKEEMMKHKVRTVKLSGKYERKG